MKTSFKLSVLAASLMATLGSSAPALAADDVNVYSYRKEVLIRPLLDAFTAKTGIKVNLVSGKAGALLSRLKSEGMNSPADVLLTTDAGRLIRAQQEGVLQAVKSDALNKLIPAQYRDDEGYWYGLSLRSRVIFFSNDRVKPSDVSSYEDLADPKWKGRICIRSSNNIYNQSLLASLVAHHGEAKAKAWAAGIVANLARKPQGGDRDQIKAVAAGECDVAVGNSYYYGKMLAGKKADQKKAAMATTLFWPNQDNRGAHVLIDGAHTHLADVLGAARDDELRSRADLVLLPHAQDDNAHGLVHLQNAAGDGRDVYPDPKHRFGLEPLSPRRVKQDVLLQRPGHEGAVALRKQQ